MASFVLSTYPMWIADGLIGPPTKFTTLSELSFANRLSRMIDAKPTNGRDGDAYDQKQQLEEHIPSALLPLWCVMSFSEADPRSVHQGWFPVSKNGSFFSRGWDHALYSCTTPDRISMSCPSSRWFATQNTGLRLLRLLGCGNRISFPNGEVERSKERSASRFATGQPFVAGPQRDLKARGKA